MTERPFVSIVVPCREEAGFIDRCLASIVAMDYPHDRMEVLVVEGRSRDGTREIVGDYVRRHSFVVLLDNPRGTTPAALNVGIRRARGDVIVRMDAHCTYPTHYVSRLVEWLERTGADNVGGVWHTRPANGSAKARAIAIGLSHPLGVGNAYFRIGVATPRWVDTVPFGCYRRDVFDRVGLYDEELTRNQDDELNLRLIRRGGRILLVPDVAIDYYARDSLTKLWRTYFHYGYFKPLVARKVGGILTLRQVMPGAFVAALVGLMLAALWLLAARWMLAGMIGTYLCVLVGAAVRVSARAGLRCGALLVPVFATLHVSYGLGFLRGTLDWIVRGIPGRVTDPGLSR